MISRKKGFMNYRTQASSDDPEERKLYNLRDFLKRFGNVSLCKLKHYSQICKPFSIGRNYSFIHATEDL